MEPSLLFLWIGVSFVAIGSGLTVGNIFISNWVAKLNRRLDIWESNFQQIIRNESYAQSFKDIETIITEINKESSKLHSLKEAQRFHLITALRLRYLSTNKESFPSILQNQLNKMGAEELISINNYTSEEFRKYHNKISDQRNRLERMLTIFLFLSTFFSSLGLVLVLTADIIKTTS
ncbi:MAG: hypothetical protein HYT70_01645 [Candidatus Aenigmarchaeota archaeon]|nr:hypothetical protein [Candidatus Aenigmarchaeota archaeon]